jgi:serine/threonine protein kinase
MWGWLVGLLSSLKKLFSPTKGPKPINLKKRFDIIGKTGQGSMSKVYRAIDRTIVRTVCLKVLDKMKTARFEARFPGLNRPSEGAICVALRHKHIVHTYEHGISTEREQFLVMELIEGVGLNFLIETRSPQLQGNRINFLTQISEALEYIHKEGYIHRDVCPRNTMIDKEGTVKLIDFGLAVPYKPEFCKPGNRTGTSDYLAAEVIKRKATDHRVDLFALGVTAYEMFTGALPWERSHGSFQTLQHHVNLKGRDPRDFKPDLDERTAKFLIKAVEREPEARFQSAEQFRKALQNLPPA